MTVRENDDTSSKYTYVSTSAPACVLMLKRFKKKKNDEKRWMDIKWVCDEHLLPMGGASKKKRATEEEKM